MLWNRDEGRGNLRDLLMFSWHTYGIKCMSIIEQQFSDTLNGCFYSDCLLDIRPSVGEVMSLK